MCVDFTNLNRACPKGSYPLPQIKLLVDSMVGHQLLSFMDAFSSYNQIRLDETDQEKTFFITSQGLFCYKVMPFGLKNARETYLSLQHETQSQQICVQNIVLKVFGLYGVTTRHRGQRRQNTSHIGDEAFKEHQ